MIDLLALVGVACGVGYLVISIVLLNAAKHSDANKNPISREVEFSNIGRRPFFRSSGLGFIVRLFRLEDDDLARDLIVGLTKKNLSKVPHYYSRFLRPPDGDRA